MTQNPGMDIAELWHDITREAYLDRRRRRVVGRSGRLVALCLALGASGEDLEAWVGMTRSDVRQALRGAEHWAGVLAAVAVAMWCVVVARAGAEVDGELAVAWGQVVDAATHAPLCGGAEAGR